VATLNTVAGPPEHIAQWNTSASRTAKPIKLTVSSARLDTGRWPMAASTSGRYEVCMHASTYYMNCYSKNLYTVTQHQLQLIAATLVVVWHLYRVHTAYTLRSASTGGATAHSSVQRRSR
jgi:hypothetical protein